MTDDTVTPEARLPEVLAAAVRESAERGYATVVVARADLEALLALVPAATSSPEPGLTEDERMIDRGEAAQLAAQAVAAVARPLREARAAIAARLRHEREAQPWEDDGWGTGYQEGLAFALDAIDDAISNNTEAAK